MIGANQDQSQVEIESFLFGFEEEQLLYVQQYREANGEFFSADLVKELFPFYADEPEGRDRYANAIHPYSHEEGIVGKIIFDSLLNSTSGAVTCVEGGSGVGKSCFVQKHRTTSNGLWIETTTCFPQLLKTLAVAGRSVKIVHLHGSPEDNIRSAMRRALIDGRRVPLKALIGTSANSTYRLAQWLSGEFQTIGEVDVGVEILKRDFSQDDSEFLPLATEEFLAFAPSILEMVPNYKALYWEMYGQENVEFPEVQLHYLEELEAYII